MPVHTRTTEDKAWQFKSHARRIRGPGPRQMTEERKRKSVVYGDVQENDEEERKVRYPENEKYLSGSREK